MKVNAAISFNSHVIPHLDEPWPIDHDSRLNVDILPVGSEKETIFDIGHWIPEPFLLHSLATPPDK